MQKVKERDQEYYKLKKELNEKILNPISDVDNSILKEIYEKSLELGNKSLATKIHQVMYDNRASSRIKTAERVSSSLGEWFDRDSFEGQIKKEGGVIEAPFVAEKSEAFKNSNYFTVGAHPSDIKTNPKSESEYIRRTNILIDDINYQLNIENMRNNNMENVLSEIKNFFKEDIYSKIKDKKQDELDFLKVEKTFYEIKSEVQEKILSPKSEYENNILEKVKSEVIKNNNPDLAMELEDVINENSALKRMQMAEKVQSMTGEWFNKQAFIDSVEKEGKNIIISSEKKEILKSEALKDTPYFHPGMRGESVGKDPIETKKYCKKVSVLTHDLEKELNKEMERRNKISKTLDKVKEFLGKDLYFVFSLRKNLDQKFNNENIVENVKDDIDNDKVKKFKM